MADAIATWLEIKAKLRRRMPAAEWDLAIRPARLLRVLCGKWLLVSVPPNGRVIYKFLGYRPLMMQYAYELGFGLVSTVHPDEWQRRRVREVAGWEPMFLDPEPPASRAQCPKCQSKLALGAIFCQSCGKKLTAKRRTASGLGDAPARVTNAAAVPRCAGSWERGTAALPMESAR